MPETELTHITDHVYRMSPGKPDRPSLCAVVGTEHTLMLDAGASAAHVHLFLDALKAENVRLPRYVALSHWHWDHVFGAAELNLPLIAGSLTADGLQVLSGYEWGDAALDARVATGEEIIMCASDIKAELPEPRDVRIVLPEIVFEKSLDIHLGGGVTCHLQHVGGDHAPDAVVAYIAPDKVLFLGDCLYEAIYTPVRYYTPKRLFPLLDAVLGFDAELFVEGHNPDAMTRAELEALANKLRLAGTLVEQTGPDEAAVFKAAEAHLPDEDMESFLRAFIAGCSL